MWGCWSFRHPIFARGSSRWPGVAASYILLVTYEVVWLGGDSFFPELSSRLFAMPYAEKVFKADGFYFYLVCLLLAWGWAYAKYWRFAWGETIPRKKRFFVISAMGLTALVIAVLLMRYKYLVVFFAVPFSVVIARFSRWLRLRSVRRCGGTWWWWRAWDCCFSSKTM